MTLTGSGLSASGITEYLCEKIFRRGKDSELSMFL